MQCSLVGKAQEVCAALPIEDSLNYDVVKLAVLRAYELVPEAYRQKFRACSTTAKQFFVEFTHEKKALFEKWCLSTKNTTIEDLQELILLDDSESCLPESIIVHLNKQKISKLTDAPLRVGKKQLIAAQKSGVSLSIYISAATDRTQISDVPVG